MSVDFKHIEVSGKVTGKKAKAELIVVRSKDQLIKAKLTAWILTAAMLTASVFVADNSTE
jgi:hypothetical protein